MKKLDRELGLFAVFSISCGAMIGSGIFVLPGLAASIGGPVVFLAYTLAGLLVLPAALSKAELATAMPESGGTYLYLDRSLGPLAGTITGLGTWISLILKSAFALVGLSAYLVLFVPLDPGIAPYFGAIIAVVLIAMNCRGVKLSGQIQSFLVLITLLALILFIGRGSLFIEKNHFKTLLPGGFLGFLSAVAFIFVSYAGVTKIASTAEEIRNPGRNIPWGILLSLITMILVYTLVVYVIVGAVPLENLGEGGSKLTPVSVAGQAIMGKWGQLIMAAVAVLALSSMANAGLMSSSRYPLAMARDNHLPGFFESIHGEWGTPVRSILLTGGILILFILVLPVKELAKLASAFTLLVFGLVNLAVVVFRESEIEWYKPEFQSPLYPYIQIAGALGSIFLLCILGWYDLYPLIGATALVGFSYVWYVFYAQSRIDRQGAFFRTEADEDEIRLFNRARSASFTTKESVIVPFMGLEGADMIQVERRIRLASSLCNPDQRLDVVDFVEVPEQSFLSGYDYDSEAFSALEERVDLLRDGADHEIHVDQVITHSSRGALLNYAEEENPHWVVFDWKEPSAWQLLIGNRKWWLEDFPCDTLFFQDKDKPEFNRVVVLTEPGPYDGEVVYAADCIALEFAGKLEFLNLFDTTDRSMQGYVESYQRELLDMAKAPAEARTLSDEEGIEGVLEAAENADLMVFGGLTGEMFPGFQDEQTIRRLAREAPCSVARVRSNLQSPRTVLSESEESISLGDYLDNSRIVRDFSPPNKGSLFEEIARRMAEDGLVAERIEEALWKREKIQNTYISNNVGFPHGILDELDRTLFRIFVLDKPVSYTEDRDPVRICVVTLGPPGDRQTHLRIIGELSRLFVETDLKDRLLQGEDPGQVLETE